MGALVDPIQVQEGNSFVIPFVLRQRGKRGGWDVSTATKIQLEVSNSAGVSLPPIMADPNHPSADWEDGEVPIQIGPDDVTAVIGTYRGVVTVFIGSEEISIPQDDSFDIEINDRPGYPPPP